VQHFAWLSKAAERHSESFFPLFATALIGIGYYPERRRALRLLGDALQPKEDGMMATRSVPLARCIVPGVLRCGSASPKP